MYFIYISTYLGNWQLNNCLVVYIEKNVANNIDSEKLSYHTTILKYENL